MNTFFKNFNAPHAIFLVILTKLYRMFLFSINPNTRLLAEMGLINLFLVKELAKYHDFFKFSVLHDFWRSFRKFHDSSRFLWTRKKPWTLIFRIGDDNIRKIEQFQKKKKNDWLTCHLKKKKSLYWSVQGDNRSCCLLPMWASLLPA